MEKVFRFFSVLFPIHGRMVLNTIVIEVLGVLLIGMLTLLLNVQPVTAESTEMYDGEGGDEMGETSPSSVNSRAWKENCAWDSDGDGDYDFCLRYTEEKDQVHFDLNENGSIDAGEPYHTQVQGWSLTSQANGIKGEISMAPYHHNEAFYWVYDYNSDGDTADQDECIYIPWQLNTYDSNEDGTDDVHIRSNWPPTAAHPNGWGYWGFHLDRNKDDWTQDSNPRESCLQAKGGYTVSEVEYLGATWLEIYVVGVLFDHIAWVKDLNSDGDIDDLGEVIETDVPHAVPALSELGMIILCIFLGGSVLFVLRRRTRQEFV